MKEGVMQIVVFKNLSDFSSQFKKISKGNFKIEDSLIYEKISLQVMI